MFLVFRCELRCDVLHYGTFKSLGMPRIGPVQRDKKVLWSGGALSAVGVTLALQLRHRKGKQMASASNVVQMVPAPPMKESEKKFGRAVMSHGQFIIPALLLRAQARLLISSTQMVVLLQLLDFWWMKDSSAHPSMSKIAERIGLTTKQVQRSVNALVKVGLITRINRRLPAGGKTSNQYQFDGLIAKLNLIEADFEVARKVKRAAGKPGGLAANKE